MRVFVVSGLVFSIPSQEIGLGKRLRNDLFCVEWDVKPELNQSVVRRDCSEVYVKYWIGSGLAVLFCIKVMKKSVSSQFCQTVHKTFSEVPSSSHLVICCAT